MAVREILHLGQPLLWKKSAEVRDPSRPEIPGLIGDLKDTLVDFRKNHGFGRGISAPQIGVLRQVLYVDMRDGRFQGPLIDPVIQATSEQTIEEWDSCFSFPDLLVRVARGRSVTVRYLDAAGNEQTIVAEDDFATLLQHEIDHLHGILAVQKAATPRSFMTRTAWERLEKPQA